MKNLILIIFSFYCLNVSAQNVVKELSNTEKFYAKAGSLFQKEFLPIGKFKGAEIQVIYISDLIDNSKISGLKFEKEVYGKYANDTKSAFLDNDEIDDFIKSIEYIMNNTLKTIPSNYTEVNYTSRSGFQSGCYYSKNKWNVYLKLEKFDGDSYVWFNVDELNELLTIIKNAKAKL